MTHDVESQSQAAPAWSEVLNTTESAEHVVTLANEYLARLAPSEVFILPARCKPRGLRSASDVNAYAIDLKMAATTDIREAQVVARIAAFFQEASQRLALLAGPSRAHSSGLWDLWAAARKD